MHTVIGTREARAHWGQLLRRLAQGERFTITKCGTPMADLVPAARSAPARPRVADVARAKRRKRQSRSRP